jgi:hypothetical protein
MLSARRSAVTTMADKLVGSSDGVSASAATAGEDKGLDVSSMNRTAAAVRAARAVCFIPSPCGLYWP